MAVQLTRHVASRSIRTPALLEAERALLQAINERVRLGDLSRDTAEAKVSGLLADIWNEAERLIRTLRDDGERT